MAAAMNIVAIQDKDLNEKACGRIVFWTLSGDVSQPGLTKALDSEQSTASAPDEPSATVALHRAVDSVARFAKADAHHTARGAWAIVNRPTKRVDNVEDDAPLTKELVYPIRCEATLVGGTVFANGEGAEKIREAFDTAKKVLAPTDIGNWLCDRLEAFGAVPLRQRGGVYFVPRDVCPEWEKVTRALAKTSAHAVHSVPAMRSDEAVDAILAAITADTQAQCDAINAEVQDGLKQRRALDSREKKMETLLARLGQYEGILGTRLEALRDTIDNVKGSITAAIMMLESDDE